MRHTVSLVALTATLGVGCHAKLRRAAPYIEDVNVQVVTDRADAYVSMSSDDSAAVIFDDEADVSASASIDLGAIVAARQGRHIEAAVTTYTLGDAMHQGLTATLERGIPFYSDEWDPDAELRVELLRYGVESDFVGDLGRYVYRARVEVYHAGRRIYRARHRCTVDPFTSELSANAFAVISNVRVVKRMTDEEINDAFTEAAFLCGDQFARWVYARSR